MPLEVFPTTAEHLVAAAEAVVLKATGCDAAFVAQFIDVPQPPAENALQMAVQLGLISYDPATGFTPRRPLAVYLVTGSETQKAAILRLVLEDYEPFRVFRARLHVLGLAPDAAQQAKQLLNLPRHRDEIKDTLISLGTYTQTVRSEGAGLFQVVEVDSRRADFVRIVVEVAADRAAADLAVRKRLGTAAGWVNEDEVLSPLVTAYQRTTEDDTRAPVLYAGNAVESFLSQLGQHFGTNLAGANGINAKVDRLRQAGNITTKHGFVLKYLGHIRNAADHGVDSEIGAPWEISKETSVEYVHVAMSTIRSMVLRINGTYIL